MNHAEGIQFFVLDISVILMAIIIVALCVVSCFLYKKHKEQKKLYDALNATVDRILEIDASGGIDGRKIARKERVGRQD